MRRGGGLDATLLATGALTVAGFLIRLRGLDQSLWSDEFLTIGHVDGSLGDVFHGLVSDRGTDSENNPPLFFVLSWLGAQLGDSPWLARLPSLFLGTATIPLAYMLGVRTVGRLPGVVAAAFVALSPFAVYYSDEARPYATLAFLTTLSTLVLLRALGTRRLGWWAAYALSVCAVLYTHNTGLFVLAAQAVWALWAHRERWRSVLGANAAALVGFAPWLPHYHARSLWVFDLQASGFHLKAPSSLVVWLMGVPFVPVRDMPGAVPLALLALAVVVAVALAVREGVDLGPDPRMLALVGLLAVATPAGLLAYQVFGGHNLIALTRNLIASFVPAVLLLGWILSRPRAPAARAAALALAGLALVTVCAKNFEDRFERPPMNSVAAYLDSHMTARDTLLYAGAGLGPKVMHRYLEVYFQRPHAQGGADAAGFEAAAARGGRVYLIRWQSLGPPQLPTEAAARVRPAGVRWFPRDKPWLGTPGLVVSIYSQ